MSCVANITVRYANGQPASFASVSVYEVIRIWLIELDFWVTSKTCDVNGRVSFSLLRGRKYHFVFRAGAKKGDIIKVLDTCPWYVGATFPS